MTDTSDPARRTHWTIPDIDCLIYDYGRAYAKWDQSLSTADLDAATDLKCEIMRKIGALGPSLAPTVPEGKVLVSRRVVERIKHILGADDDVLGLSVHDIDSEARDDLDDALDDLLADLAARAEPATENPS